jgi:hypothetical protein
MTTRFCPRCEQKHSNRRNCDGSKRTVDERIVSQQERLTSIHMDHGARTAEALLQMGPGIRSVWWNKGGACRLCRQGLRQTQVVVLPLGGIATAIVHHSCAQRFLQDFEADGSTDE